MVIKRHALICVDFVFFRFDALDRRYTIEIDLIVLIAIGADEGAGDGSIFV